MRFFVVGALLALNGLAIYFGGSEVGFGSSLGTVIAIGFYVSWSLAVTACVRSPRPR